MSRDGDDSKWFYTDIKSEVMYCSHCYEDDQYMMVDSTRYIITMKQNVICKFCSWCPKKHGIIRPDSLHSGYVSKINCYRKMPDKLEK